MMKKLPWVLLGLSILFNFFFAGGFVSARSETVPFETEDEAVDAVADKLDLDQSQKDALTEMRRRVRQASDEARHAVGHARRDLWAGMAEASENGAKVAELVEFESDQQTKVRLLAAEQFRNFMGILKPHQRQKAMGLLHRRPPHGSRPRRPGARFDTDGDGRLSETERHAARKDYEGRIESFRQQRRKRMFRETDTDGDGWLSDEERRSAGHLLRDWFQRRHTELLRKYDSDGDGTLNPQERERARKEFWSRGGGNGPRPRR